MAKKQTKAAKPPPPDDLVPTGSPNGGKPASTFAEFKKTKRWEKLKQEFSKDELDFFAEEYESTLEQFKGNLLHTELGQLIDIIRYEVMKHRCLIAKKQAVDEIASFERSLDEFMENCDTSRQQTDQEREQLLDLQNRINIAKQREADQTKTFNSLQERLDKLRTATSSSRDQRINDLLDDGKTDFVAVIKSLQGLDQQERKSRDLQLIRMAGQKELAELGKPHTYDDKTVDLPILSCDSIMALDAANKSQEEDAEA